MPQYSPPDRYAMNLNSRPSLIRHTIVLSMLAALTVAFGIGAAASPASAALNTDWTMHTPPDANSWRSVAFGNGLFVAVSDDGTNRAMTSTDGVSWTTRTAAAANRWQSVAFGAGKFVAVSNDGANRVMMSTNGANWSQPGTPISSGSWNSITYGNGLFVAVGGSGVVMASSDGETWTSGSAPSKNWRAVTSGAGKFVAVTSTATDQYQAMTSTNGTTWDNTNLTLTPKSNWDGVTFGNGTFVAVASGGPGVLAMASANGTSWTAGTTSQSTKEWTSAVYANGQFVAVSDDTINEMAMVSPDGITWTDQTTPSICRWTSVTYGAGKYVAVADYNANYNCGTQLVMTSDAILPPTPSTNTQTAGSCVTPGNAGSIPRSGSRQLMAANCTTNAGQPVAVRVTGVTPRSLKTRGDYPYYNLYCKVSKSKTTATKSAGYGKGYRICKKGSLRIRTYGQPLKLRVTWYAPATTDYDAYKLSKKYKS